jgi:hypothetical protein
MQSYTDVIFSFGIVTDTFELDTRDGDDLIALTRFQARGASFPGLKLHIAVGGYTFNNAPTGMVIYAFFSHLHYN